MTPLLQCKHAGQRLLHMNFEFTKTIFALVNMAMLCVAVLCWPVFVVGETLYLDTSYMFET